MLVPEMSAGAGLDAGHWAGHVPKLCGGGGGGGPDFGENLKYSCSSMSPPMVISARLPGVCRLGGGMVR